MKQQSPCKTCSRFLCNLHSKCKARYEYSLSLGDITFKSTLSNLSYGFLPK